LEYSTYTFDKELWSTAGEFPAMHVYTDVKGISAGCVTCLVHLFIPEPQVPDKMMRIMHLSTARIVTKQVSKISCHMFIPQII
jgi:hypothetical protein